MTAMLDERMASKLVMVGTWVNKWPVIRQGKFLLCWSFENVSVGAS
jgi:hypothetical protein